MKVLAYQKPKAAFRFEVEKAQRNTNNIPVRTTIFERGRHHLETSHTLSTITRTSPHSFRSATMDVDKIPNYLDEQREAAPEDLQHYFLSFHDFWERKLWHELTDQLMAYFDDPQSGPQRISMYNTFIKTFADKISKLKLVHLGTLAAAECKGV